MNLPTPQGFDLVVALKERESGRLHSLDATTDNLHTESMPVEHRHETLLSFVRAYQSAVADTNPLPVQHNTRLAFRVDHSPRRRIDDGIHYLPEEVLCKSVDGREDIEITLSFLGFTVERFIFYLKTPFKEPEAFTVSELADALWADVVEADRPPDIQDLPDLDVEVGYTLRRLPTDEDPDAFLGRSTLFNAAPKHFPVIRISEKENLRNHPEFDVDNDCEDDGSPL